MGYPEISFIPKVTTSKEVFIRHIKSIYINDKYSKYDISEELLDSWIARVINKIDGAQYFEGYIYIAWLSPTLIIHELGHHISRLLKGWTNSVRWYNAIDKLIDNLDIFIFRKEIDMNEY